MIFTFCLWRLHLEHKLSTINRFIPKRNFNTNDIPINPEGVEKTRKSFIGFHPKIKSINNRTNQITIRE